MSPKTEAHRTRICVLFMAVRHIDLPSVIDIDNVREQALGGGEHRYAIATAAGNYRVDALAMAVDEDELDFGETNILDRRMGPNTL